MPEPLSCYWCGEAIDPSEPHDRIPFLDAQMQPHWAYRHRECMIRSVVGGVNHLMGRCCCCGGDLPPDPPDLTRREAARQAVALWESQGDVPHH